MTDVAVRPGSDMEELHEWVYAASKVHQMATALAKTAFVPAAIRGRADEITAVIMAGREIGFKPMQSLRSIDIIDGKPALSALGLRALLQQHGHEVWVEASSPSVVTVCGRRKDTEHVQSSTWTMGRAQQAGLADKTNWKRHPSAMLTARATAEVARLIAADALLGVPYTSDEVSDEADEAPAPVPAEPKTFQRDMPTDDLADAAFAIGTAAVPELAAQPHDEEVSS